MARQQQSPETISGYSRQMPGLGNAQAPDARGMRGAMSAQAQYLNGLGNLLGEVSNFANTYLDIVNERKERDADTEVSKIFRERRMEVFNTRKGKSADSLLDDEDKWQRETMEEVKEKFGIGTHRFKGIWNKHADPYLDRMGAFQVEQQAAYDKQSRLANAEAGLDTLITTRIGDMTAVQEYFAKVQALFPNDPATVEKLKEQGINTAVKGWSRINASATVSWFRSNRDNIVKAIGKDFVKVSDVVQGAENHIRAEASHAETLASRADRIARKQQEAYNDKQYNDSVQKILGGDFGPADMFAVADDNRLSGEVKAKVYSLAERVEKNDFSKASGLKSSQALSDAYTGNMDEGRFKQVMDDASAGLISPDQLKSIQSARQQYETSVRGEIKPAVDSASKYLKNYYAPSSGLMGRADPVQEQRYMQVNNALLSYVKGKDAVTVLKALDFNEPSSWINQLIKVNAYTPPMSNVGKPLQLNYRPAVPGAVGAEVLPVGKQKRPNESFADWKKRVGQK